MVTRSPGRLSSTLPGRSEAFDGSPLALVLNVLETSDLDKKELAQLRQQLREIEKQEGKS